MQFTTAPVPAEFRITLKTGCFQNNIKQKTSQVLVDLRGSFMAPPVGLEPTTCGLTVRRSTD